MIALADRIDRITGAIGRAVAWLVLAVVLLQFALVVARYVFSFGSIKLSETVIYAHAAVIMLAAAWTLAAEGHVRLDVFYASASVRTKAVVDLFGSLLLLLPFALVLLWLSAPFAARSWAILERSHETSGLPLVFVLKTFIPLFALLMALQGIAQAIRAVFVIFPPPLAGEGGRPTGPRTRIGASRRPGTGSSRPDDRLRRPGGG